MALSQSLSSGSLAWSGSDSVVSYSSEGENDGVGSTTLLPYVTFLRPKARFVAIQDGRM